MPTIAITGANTSQPLFTLGFSTNGPSRESIRSIRPTTASQRRSAIMHTKFGYDWRKYLVWNPFGARNSGSFGFTTSSNNFTSGDAGLDFLLGMPASYSQGSGAYINAYAFLNYMYAQDTWKATPSLTLSYGLGYQIDTPLHTFSSAASE